MDLTLFLHDNQFNIQKVKRLKHEKNKKKAQVAQPYNIYIYILNRLRMI